MPGCPALVALQIQLQLQFRSPNRHLKISTNSLRCTAQNLFRRSGGFVQALVGVAAVVIVSTSVDSDCYIAVIIGIGISVVTDITDDVIAIAVTIARVVVVSKSSQLFMTRNVKKLVQDHFLEKK